MTYLIDTNIITAIMKGNEKIKEKLQQVIEEDEKILINGVSYYEIKRGLLSANAQKQLERFNNLCATFGLIFFDNQSIFNRAAEIYSELKLRGKLIEDADILIAALTETRNFILVSDDNDFERIPGIKIENWLK